MTALALVPFFLLAAVAPDANESPRAAQEPATTSDVAREGLVLDEITIEGDIDVPQVLFITARDHLRLANSQHAIYWTDPIATVLDRPTIGPVRPPVDDDADTAEPAPQPEN